MTDSPVEAELRRRNAELTAELSDARNTIGELSAQAETSDQLVRSVLAEALGVPVPMRDPLREAVQAAARAYRNLIEQAPPD